MYGGQGPSQQPWVDGQHGQLQPFGGGFGRDPFGEMMSPFGMFGGGRGGGGGLFGGLFGEMDRMMQEMDSMVMGNGGNMRASMSGGGGGMMMMGSSTGGGGTYTQQTMVMSSSVGQDGRVRTERFSSSAVGDYNGQMREVQQAYSNNHTGVNKMSLERQLDGRGRKMVKEQYAATGEERTTDMYKGMSEDQSHDFERDWNARAKPRLPQHSQGMRPFMLSDGAGPAGGYPSRGQRTQAAGVARPALPIAPQQQPQQQQQRRGVPSSASASWR